ncbi:PDR/VanB family oxidoreductase [Streptomyces sp. NPDC050743]|uniref:PDR/VanB family oxidoreductase n=1 Tax=Streptomyces sp. NPDC050743 TaxID=3365634 RepID=UPI003791FB18
MSLELTATAVDDSVPSIRSITFAAADGGPLPAFVPGSHLVIECGEKSNAYSLTSDGTDPSSYSISVLHVADGAGGSRWVHEALRVGDTVAAHMPRSAFAPVARATKHLLIAGGIGVTPIVSHLRAARLWGRTVQVLYTYRDGFAAHVDDVLKLADGAAELFAEPQEFLDRLEKVLGDQPVGTHLYVCGPPGMIDHVLARASALGWPESRLHFERFGADALDPGDPFTVTLTNTGVTLDVPSGTSLLEALESAGVPVPNLCRQGVCGECRIPLSGGTPLHRDLYLSDDEKAAGNALMACVSRADGTTLEVPL